MAVKKVRRRVSFVISEDDEPAREPERTVQAGNISVVVDNEDDASLDGAGDKPAVSKAPNAPKASSSDEKESESDESSSSEDEKPSEKAVKRKRSGTPRDEKKSTGVEADEQVSDSDSESGSSSESSGSDSDDSEDEEEAAADESKDDPSREKVPSPVTSFGEMALDARVERAIERIGWRRPTPVQSAVVPVALSGRDLLVSAPTGSGKTAAYGIPIAQQLCRDEAQLTGIRVIVFVPTRELVHQVSSVMKLLVRYIDGIRVAGIVGRRTVRKKKKSKRSGKDGGEATEDGFCGFDTTADILVGTPASVAEMATKTNGEAVKNVELVVMDEADLVLSYGYENDARVALTAIPSSVQAMLFSATLDADGMDAFRKVVLRRPLTVKITTGAEVADGDPTGVAHYFARLGTPKDRYLVAYAMLRLNVLRGKVLIFVNHINAGFRLKLFLDQFKVKTAVLNCELPANSRVHCVDQFNAGIFDVLIATDEVQRDSSLVVKDGDVQKSSRLRHREKHNKKRQRDAEFGLSRGVDFRNVAAVLNFDVPGDLTSYTHRAGRTARAGATGTVLSLVVSAKEQESIVTMGKELGVPVGPLAFRMEQIEAFRYRVEDCLRMVTDAAVTQARLADVRREMVNSEKLKDYFDDNPQDLDALKHDLALAKHVPDHLAHIPSYLLPPALRASVSQEPDGSRFRIRKRVDGLRKKTKKVSSRNDDPLKRLSVVGRRSGTSRERFESRHKLKKTIKKGNFKRHSRR